MKLLFEDLKSNIASAIDGWNKFWFSPTDPSVIGLIRLLAGSMLFYTHLVWSKRLLLFFGKDGWLPTEPNSIANNGSGFAWSYLHWISDPTTLWIVHSIALIILFMFAIGLFTRVTSVLSLLIAISYCNRATGLLFGLDQINVFLVLYLSIAPSGAAFSIDRMISKMRGRAGELKKSVTANIATRLIQTHMCVVYLFAGAGKLLGETWWNGEAIWISVANYEYQSMDLTWLVHFPWIVNALTHLTVLFELSYIALIWPKATRPLVLLTAVMLHLGIAFGMGMMTFGLIMIIANLAFVSPRIVRLIANRSETAHA